MFEIVYSNKFERKLNNLYKDHPRLDELRKAITWSLERNPRFSMNIEGDYYLWVTEQLPVKTIPKVRIIYLVDNVNRQVKLLSIEAHIDQP